MTSIKLKSLHLNPKTTPREIDMVYDVTHNTGRMSLEQELLLTRDIEGWKADMLFDGMPSADNPTDAVEKLADWLERMAESLRKFDPTIDLNKL